jgi:hypothetical protein
MSDLHKVHRAARIAELEAQLKQIEEKNAYWKSHPNQDGSYEAAITYDGYYTLRRKLDAIKASSED